MIRYVAFLPFLLPNLLLAFPENIRMGYASCAMCHINPTGGGLVTEYGKQASSEFLSTWHFAQAQTSDEKEPTLTWGSDIRVLGYTTKTGLVEKSGLIPMQLDAKAGYRFLDWYTAVVSLGFYDGPVQFRNAYILAKINESIFTRFGKFFPAYGINTPDHSIPTRSALGFGQGRESLNVELGFANDVGELVIDAILSEASDGISAEETGGTARLAWYAAGKNQIGASLLMTDSKVWKRTMYGLFAMVGFSRSLYLLAEVDEEFRKPTENDTSTPENSRIVTWNKVGWEFQPGIHAFVSYGSCVNILGNFDPDTHTWGPGLQWYPIDGLELIAQIRQREVSSLPNQPGYAGTLMLHLYF